MKWIATLFASLAVCCSNTWAADDFEFKGIRPGMAYADLAANPKLRCEERKNDPVAEYACTLNYGEKETIAGTPVKFLAVFVLSGKVTTLTASFDTSQYLQVKLALIEKYGTGEVTDSEIQNRMGASFDNQKVEWTGKDATMRLDKRSGKIDTGRFTIQAKASTEEFKRRMLKDSKDHAKDL